MSQQFNFNYAVNLDRQPVFTYAHNPLNKKEYLEWHDIIDIKVPLFIDPSILLGKRVPLPLHGRNPRSILTELDEDWWNRTRKKVYESQDRHCACCGTPQAKQKGWITNQLDAHEVYDIDWKTGEVRLAYIVPLCKYCHNYVHFGRLTAQKDSGKIQEKTFYSIISHGNSILKANNLPMKNLDASVDDNVYCVPWNEWHLTLTVEGEDKSYYSLFKDKEELEAHYA